MSEKKTTLLNHSTKETCFSIFAIFAGSFLVFLPLFASGNWFDCHDGIRFLCLFEQFRDAFKEGILYPRWLPDNYGGYGYPDFVFYQPAFFYFVLPFSFLFVDTLISFFAAMLILLFLGGLGIYCISRRFSDELASTASSLFFILTPYIYVNIYVRGDLAEFASMMILPWCFFLLIKINDAIKNGSDFTVTFVLKSLLLGLLVYTHPFTALFFFPVFLLSSVFPYLDGEFKNARKLFLLTLLAIFAGSSLSAPYWLPAFAMKGYVNYKSALSGELQTQLHLLYPSQLFSTKWGFGGSASGPCDGMSFQLGLPHFILACAGALITKEKFLKILFAIYVSSLIFMLDIEFFRFIWGKTPLLNMVQFPWRLLSLVATLQIISAIPCFSRISQGKKERAIAIFALFFLFVSFFYHQMFLMESSEANTRKVLKQHVEGRRLIMASYSSFDEFFPSYISKKPDYPRGNEEILQIVKGKADIQKLSRSSAYRYSIVIAGQEKLTARVLQFYFPGTTVLQNYKDISDSLNIAEDGTFFFEIPPGEHLIEIYYAGTPFDFIAITVTIIASFFATFAFSFLKKYI